MARFDEERLVDFESWEWLLTIAVHVVTLAGGLYLGAQLSGDSGSFLIAFFAGMLTGVLSQLVLWFGIRTQVEPENLPQTRADRINGFVNLGIGLLLAGYLIYRAKSNFMSPTRPYEMVLGGLWMGNYIMLTIRSFGFLKTRIKQVS